MKNNHSQKNDQISPSPLIISSQTLLLYFFFKVNPADIKSKFIDNDIGNSKRLKPKGPPVVLIATKLKGKK